MSSEKGTSSSIVDEDQPVGSTLVRKQPARTESLKLDPMRKGQPRAPNGPGRHPIAHPDQTL